MSVGGVSSRSLPRFTNSVVNARICQSCRKDLLRRRYASASAAVAESDSNVSSSPPIAEASSPQPSCNIAAGVLLSRPPQITRDLDPFEKAFYFYQKRLNERLSLPFTRYFYFKRGTPAYLDWRRKQEKRQTAASDIGNYGAYSKEAWNDELLVGAQESEPANLTEALIQDAFEGAGDEAKLDLVERPMPRVTKADIEGDQKSLNRLLQRTVYLLVKKELGWTLPMARLQGRENLREAAERILVDAAGVNMNTWFVGHAPVGHLTLAPLSHLSKNEPKSGSGGSPNTAADQDELTSGADKAFFMKARILAGQADLKENKLGLSEFKWLAKEEIKSVVSPGYWARVKNMLAER